LNQSSAGASIRCNDEFDLSEIDESELQLYKDDDPRISTFRGILIDPSDEDENA
jgi:hypothetical protein